jgi:DNA-binding response OmpR family regulator
MPDLKRILLIDDDQRELDFISSNLSENGYNIDVSATLKEGSEKIQKEIPDLIVINTSDNESSIRSFMKEVKTERLKDVLILSLIELESYLKLTDPQQYVIKPMRPKLLLSLIRGIMNREAVDWLQSVH